MVSFFAARALSPFLTRDEVRARLAHFTIRTAQSIVSIPMQRAVCVLIEDGITAGNGRDVGEDVAGGIAALRRMPKDASAAMLGTHKAE